MTALEAPGHHEEAFCDRIVTGDGDQRAEQAGDPARSPNSCAQASAYGTPPESPTTMKRS